MARREQRYSAPDLYGPALPLLPRDSKWEAANRELHDFAKPFVEKALKYRRALEADQGSDEKESDRYVFLWVLAKENEDPEYLRDHLLGMLLVGSETTASLLTGCLWYLSYRPDLWTRLRTEVMQTLEDHQPSYERVKSLTLLGWVLDEGNSVLPVSTHAMFFETDNC